MDIDEGEVSKGETGTRQEQEQDHYAAAVRRSTVPKVRQMAVLSCSFIRLYWYNLDKVYRVVSYPLRPVPGT